MLTRFIAWLKSTQTRPQSAITIAITAAITTAGALLLAALIYR